MEASPASGSSPSTRAAAPNAARTARAVPIEGHAAYTPQEACARAAEVGIDCLPANGVGAALEDLLATQPAPMRILICGSLYLAGTVLARNG